jgi:methylphosphotriester-DNA--protein-cysteine methyltransferase
MKPFTYRELAPPQELAEHLLSYWEFRVHGVEPGGVVHPVWPDGCMSLAVAANGQTIFVNVIGPTLAARRVTVEDGAVVRGARFWPDAGSVVLGLDAETTRDGRVPAVEVLGSAANELAQAVAAASDLEAAGRAFARVVAPRVRAAAPLDVHVRAAVSTIRAARGMTPIGSLTRDAGLSARQLRRRFQRAVGLSPKEYSRVRRLRSAIGAVLTLAPEAWSAVAADLGYTDQSHLIRDVTQLTGMTPHALKARLEMIEHANVTP